MTRAKINDMIRRTQTYAILNAGRIDTPGCVQLSTYDRLVWKVRIQADPDNTASVFVGNQWKHPYELIPGAELEIPIDFVHKIYVRITAGDAVNWWAMGSTAQISRFPSAYTKKVFDTGPIAYWTQGDPFLPTAVDQIDSPAQDGAYSAAGVTLGQQGIGDGLTSAEYDGAAGYTNVYSAALAAAFSGLAGSAFVWARVTNAGVWTSGANGVILRLQADANNFLYIRKDAVNNRLQWSMRGSGAGGGPFPVAYTSTDWFLVGATWGAGAYQIYLNGVLSGGPGALGAWVGALSATGTVIGAGNTVPAVVFPGYIAHCAVWDRPLTPAEIADLYIVPGP